MPDLVDAAMTLEATVKKYLEKDNNLRVVINKMEPLFRKIYDGEVPPQRMFEAIADKYSEAFEEHDDLSEAFDALNDAYDEAHLEQIRKSVGSKFVDHLKRTWTERTCPVCRRQVWTVPKCQFEVREFSGGALVIGGDMNLFVVIPVVCEECGYTHFFSATRSGVIKANVSWPRLPSP